MTEHDTKPEDGDGTPVEPEGVEEMPAESEGADDLDLTAALQDLRAADVSPASAPGEAEPGLQDESTLVEEALFETKVLDEVDAGSAEPPAEQVTWSGYRPLPEPESDLLWSSDADTDEAADGPLFGGSSVEDQSPAPADAGATAVMPSVVEDASFGVDLGPEAPRRWWIWVIVAVVALLVVGAAGYAWWWTTARPIRVPDVIGKKAAQATQAINDAGLVLGKVSELPTDTAPVGTILSQEPSAKTTLKPGDTVTFVVAAAPELAKTPNVVGISTDDATVALAEQRLRPYVVESFSTTVPAGFVIGQLPPSGYELPPGTSVALAVSKGMAPSATTIPQTVGLPENDGVTLVQARQLKARVYRSRDASVAAGIILAQTPLPGSSVTPDTVVQILVSSGPTPGAASVPNVTGSTKAKAVAALKAHKMTPEVVNMTSATVPKGKVISQMPPAGKSVASGALVGLLVSTGPAKAAVVPSLVGTSSIDTSKTIIAAGYRPVILAIPARSEAPGQVFGQFPPAGTSYPRSYPLICLVAESLKK